MQEKKEVVVAVSGGFDPIHPGHIRLFEEAKALGDKLVVILNNDNWLLKKKKFVFMNEKERKEVIAALRVVDEVVISKHPKNPEDMSVSKDLIDLGPDIFANGGDRNEKDAANPSSTLFSDIQTCKKLGVKMVFSVGHGGKIQSSSWLIEKAMKTAPRKVAVNFKKSRG